MRIDIPDHPDIVSAMKTGYGLHNQPKSYYCGECGECLDNQEIYETENYEFLCENCLLILHKKWW